MKKILAIALLWFSGIATAQAPAVALPATPAPTPNAAAPANNAAPLGGNVGDRNSVYTDRIPAEQILTLDASGDKFQARHIPDLSGQPRGAVIILHDSGQHPSWPFTAAALIDDLPLHGWDTLNIELPAPAADAPKPEANTATATPPAPNSAAQPAPNTAAPASTATATAASTAIEPRAQARINAAIKYFLDQRQRNIVLIGFGSGATRAAETLRLTAGTKTTASTEPVPLTALVMIAPQQKLNGIDMDLPKLLPLTEIPALDLSLDSDPLARADAEARRRAVLHQRTRIYTRLELPPLNNTSSAQNSTMVKRVRSWMQLHAKQPEQGTDKNLPAAPPQNLPAPAQQ